MHCFGKVGAAVTTVVLGTLGTGWSAGHAQVSCVRQVVDDFTEPAVSQLVVDGNLTSDSQVDSGLASAIGGERDGTLELTQAGPFLANSANLTTNGSGVVFWSHQVGVQSRFSFTWDGSDGDASTLDADGLGGVDVTGDGPGGAFRFEIDFYDSPTTATPFTLEVHSAGGRSSSLTVTPPTPSAGAVVEFPLTSFTPVSGGGADFSDVGALVLSGGPPSADSLDLTFGALTAPSAATPPDPDPDPDPEPEPVDPQPSGSPAAGGPVAGTPTLTG